jgi:lipoate---protein ligase
MLCINNDSTNPYFNLALEEYILKTFLSECFMLWRDSPSIIVGKNQNSLSEINIDYVRENSIPVVRRLSGGGSVFHDLGNLNFTFIINDTEDNFINFQKFTLPIIEVLKKLSVNAELSGRNDLTIDGKKFSGNAQYKFKNRLLHHGTLLFASNIADLSAALKVNPSKFEGKGIKSVASRVTNIAEHLKQPLALVEFKQMILTHIRASHKEFELYELKQTDIDAVNKLMRDKYSTREWNYGNSPAYNFKNRRKFAAGSIEVYFSVNDGIINQVKIFGDFFSKYDISDVEISLVGVKHDEKSIRQALANLNMDYYFSNINKDAFISVLFRQPV